MELAGKKIFISVEKSEIIQFLLNHMLFKGGHIFLRKQAKYLLLLPIVHLNTL